MKLVKIQTIIRFLIRFKINFHQVIKTTWNKDTQLTQKIFGVPMEKFLSPATRK